MRRMLTETEVEKLDSIKPSEIEKLGKITEADIESVKAMQSPKNARANQVLTADGNGKAVYKEQTSSVKTSSSYYSNRPISTDESGTYALITVVGKRIMNAWFTSVPTVDSQKIDMSLISITPFPGTGGDTFIRIYFSPEAITRYSITTNSQFSGNIRYYYL